MRTPLIGAIAVALPLLTAAPAQAAPPVRFMYVQYDAKGKDTSKNVNGEFLVVKNYGAKAVNLAGWTIGDRARLGDSRYIFYFPAKRYVLKPNHYVVIRTGRGRNTAKTLYYGFRRHLWSNTAGQVSLFTPADKRYASCSWVAGNGLRKC